MSNKEASKKLRRNGSPSLNKQGPIRATQQFGLASPSRLLHSSPNASQTKERSRRTDRKSPSSPASSKDKIRSSSSKSNSFENLTTPYLSGQWPKDGHWSYTTIQSSSLFQCDKQTQTSEDWDEVLSDRRRLPSSRAHYRDRRSPQTISSSSDQLKKDIKQKLQRTVSTQRGTSTSGHHSPSPLLSSSQPIPIKVQPSPASAPRGTPGKARASVEGLNQEVEKLIISGRLDEDRKIFGSSMDGHRAPVQELLTRTVNTQTPSQYDSLSPSRIVNLIERSDTVERSDADDDDLSERSRSSSACSLEESDSRPLSTSPSLPLIPGDFDLEEYSVPKTKDEARHIPVIPLNLSELREGPEPKFTFQRLPPDGAEKVKLIDELSLKPVPNSNTLQHQLLAPVSNLSFKPSEKSAFRYIPGLRSHVPEAARVSPRLVEHSH